MTDEYLARCLGGSDANFRRFHGSFKQLCEAYGCSSIVVFSRVSQRFRHSRSAQNPSLAQQNTFCGRFLDGSMYIEKRQLESVSISTDSTPIIDAIGHWTDQLIVVTSTSRIARSRLGLEQLKRFCERQRLPLVVLTWPPRSIPDVAEAALSASSLLEPDAKSIIRGLEKIGSQPASLPSLCPVLVFGPPNEQYPVQEAAVRALEREVQASEDYLRGLGCSQWQGDPFIQQPATTGSSRWTPKAFEAQAKAAIAVCAPHLQVRIEHFLPGNQALDCHCRQGGQCEAGVELDCRPGCTCTCDVCRANYERHCRGPCSHTFCPCRCRNHHRSAQVSLLASRSYSGSTDADSQIQQRTPGGAR